MFDPDFSFSKQLLGQVTSILGLVAIAAMLIYEALGFGGSVGAFGPLQQIGLILAGGLFLIGLSLVPLGDDPA